MPGYVITNYTINDSEAFEKYPPAVGPTLEQYGGTSTTDGWLAIADAFVMPEG